MIRPKGLEVWGAVESVCWSPRSALCMETMQSPNAAANGCIENDRHWKSSNSESECAIAGAQTCMLHHQASKQENIRTKIGVKTREIVDQAIIREAKWDICESSHDEKITYRRGGAE